MTTCGTSPVIASAGENPPGVRLENHVQDHLAERRIHPVPVRFPVARHRIQLQRTGPQFAVDLAPRPG